MKIPTGLLDATRSRAWRTASTPPLHMQPAAAAVDDADEPASPAPTAEPPALYVPEADARVSVPPTVTPGDALLAALDACSDDAQRAALLSAASVQAREQMRTALLYREMCTLAGRNPPLGALVAALDCTDESGRAALLLATQPALLVELAEHLGHGTCEEITERYMEMLVPAHVVY